MELLKKYFDTAFAAPDGIKKLRELILTLAMQGKLVPQDQNDQPASKLLKEIENKKKQLFKEGKIKVPKTLSEIMPEETPYKLPKGWEWVRLGNISTKLTDGSHNPPKDAGSGFPMLSSQNVNYGKIDFSNPSRYVSQSDFIAENNRTQTTPGDVLLTIVASLGRPAVVPDNAPKFVLQRSVAVISSPIAPNFLCNLLSAPICIGYYDTHAKGTAQKGIYLGKLGDMPLPLPPLSEQHRIVAKIDHLMAHCDELENLRTERDHKRLTVHTSAINRLLTAQEKDSFMDAWQFINKQFNELYSGKENITELRKTILQLAVMGKLVTHNSNDTPASELLKKIEAKKKRLTMGDGLKTTANENISIKEEYVGRPNRWEYCRLGNLAKFIDYRGRTPKKVNSGIPLITAKNVRFGFINREPYEYITEYEYKNWMTRGFPIVGDLLFTTEAPLGNIAIIDISDRFALAQRVICLQLHIPEMAPFLKWLIMSVIFQKQLLDNATGMTATGIKSARLKEIPIPIPPLTEQHRIVAKIDQFMDLCDKLEHHIDVATNKQTELLGAVMAQA